MSSKGFTADGLARWRAALDSHVANGSMPGLVALVSSGDEVEVHLTGTRAIGEPSRMSRDSIFRIASLTKPVGAVVTMMLVEDGVLDLDGAVDALLPELAEPRVLRSLASELDDTVPADRSITVRDLLTNRLGFGTVMVEPGSLPIQRAESALELRTLGPPWPPTPHGPDEWIRRFGTLPLMYQPGEQWLYNTGSHLLGVLIERAARRPLTEVLEERLFHPLGMVDTGFFVRPDQLDRFTTAYTPAVDGLRLDVLDAPASSWWREPPALPNLAGWLVSTIDDYWAFVRMLRDGGEHEGHRLLSRATIEQMTTDQLTPSQRESGALFLSGGGWGLGMGAPAADGSIGYGWSGGTGTEWRTNDRDGLTGILFTQRAMTSPEPPRVVEDFWATARAALRRG
jgi:CubicO group peptidase (beta-lactamase class C family)